MPPTTQQTATTIFYRNIRWLKFVDRLGKKGAGILEYMGGIGTMVLQTLHAAVTRPFYGSQVIAQMDELGVKSLSITGITAFSVGMVLALQTAYSLAAFGGKMFTGRVVAISLVRELGLTMGDLFAAEDPPPAVASASAAARPSAPAGPLVTPDHRAVINLASGVTWERLTAASDPAIEFLRVIYDVGSESCPENSLVHHGGKECGYVIGGRLGVRIGFDEYHLGPGDSISFDASSPHRLWAIGNEPTEVIWAVVGRQGDTRTAPHS